MLISRRKTLFEARGEKQQVSEVVLKTKGVADDALVQEESQCEFLTNIGNLTPFRGLQVDERHEEPKLKRCRVSASQ